MANRKVKQQNGKIKQCNKCYSPTHIKFNFSFISMDDMTLQQKADLYDRVKEISSVPFLDMMHWSKNRGFEIVDKKQIGIKKQIPTQYESPASHRKIHSKYAILRLYPNNNPTCSRIIGHLDNMIFYVHFIDSGGKLYKH